VSLDTPLESWMRTRQARDGSQPRRPQGGEEPTAEAPKPRILQTLLVTFAVGCLLGILCPMAGEALFPQTQRGTPEEWVKPPAIRREESAEGTTGGPTGSSAEDPLRKLGSA